MSFTSKRAVVPAFRTRGLGSNTHPIVSYGSIDNGYVAVYGQLEVLPMSGTWRGIVPVASDSPNYPILFSERTIRLLCDGYNGVPALVSAYDNPVLRLPPCPWGSVGAMQGRLPRTLLFSMLDIIRYGSDGNAGNSTTFIDSCSAVLDQYNVTASNLVKSFQLTDTSIGNTFTDHPLGQGILFANTTTVTFTESITTCVPDVVNEEVGVADSSQWIAGSTYEIYVSDYFAWIGFLSDVIADQVACSLTVESPIKNITDNYIAQQQAVYSRYQKRKVHHYFLELGGFEPSVVGRAEFVRAMDALADYGFTYTIMSPASGPGVLPLATQTANLNALLYDLAADIAAFFASGT